MGALGKMAKNKKIHFAWIILIGMAIIMGVARGGINNAGGLFLSPVSKDLGIGIGELTIYFSVASIATMLFLPVAGKMLAKYDVRWLLILGIIMQAGSFALFGLMDSVWGWYILSAPMAFGAIFIATLAGPVLINRWFKKNNGLALGIMMAAVGLFGAFIQPFAGNLIAHQGWRSAYIFLGVGAIIIIIPVILLMIRTSPESKGLLPYGAKDVSIKETKEDNHDEQGVTFADAKKSMAFYSMLLFLFFMTAVASFAQHIGPYAIGSGYSIEFSGKVMGAFMAGMFVGALVFGFLTDKIGARNTGYMSMGVGIIALLLLIFVPENPIIFSLGIGLFGFVTASVGTLGPLLTSAVFGNKDYSQIYASIGIGLAVAGIVALPGYGFVFDLTGSYTLVLYMIIAMLIINMILITVAFKGKEILIDKGHYK